MTPRQMQIWRGEILTPQKCAAYRANWKAAARFKLPCDHLGSFKRLAECETCCGNVKLKVFGCAVNGECTPSKKLDGMACCGTCDQYSS